MHPPVLPAFQPFAPYNVVVVQLVEDPRIRIVGNLVDPEVRTLNSIEASDIAIGQRVRVVFESLTDEVSLPQWVLV